MTAVSAWLTLTDDEIGSTWFFRLITLLLLPFAQWFYGYEVFGKPPAGGAMLICLHTSHNQDILLNLVAMYAYFGRVVRAQIHRLVMLCNPWLRWVGVGPGDREHAIALLKAGHLVACIPGGGEEAVNGHENAYRLKWESSSGRKRTEYSTMYCFFMAAFLRIKTASFDARMKYEGFAHAARAAGVPVVPVVMRHGEEMRWIPLHWAWNKLGLSRAYDRLIARCHPSTWLHWFLTQVRFHVWFNTSWWSIPIPVKVSVHWGETITFRDGETVDEFVDRCYEVTDALVRKVNRNAPGTAYLEALRERFCSSPRRTA
eukprot:g4156.t1